MVAEKNSIALAIAKALSSNPRSSKGRTQCYYFGGTFKGKKASFIVTATNGHIFNRDFPKEYADWESVDPFKLFQASTIKKAASKGGTIHTLERCAKDCDYLLLWLDNDREGENICFEVEDVCKPFMSPNYKALRAKFSSITSQELKTAYNAINSEPNLNQSLY
jgi:DNA topoisomerase-3